MDKHDELMVRIPYRKDGIIWFTKHNIEDLTAQRAFIRTGTFLGQRLYDAVTTDNY